MKDFKIVESTHKPACEKQVTELLERGYHIVSTSIAEESESRSGYKMRIYTIMLEKR